MSNSVCGPQTGLYFGINQEFFLLFPKKTLGWDKTLEMIKLD